MKKRNALSVDSGFSDRFSAYEDGRVKALALMLCSLLLLCTIGCVSGPKYSTTLPPAIAQGVVTEEPIVGRETAITNAIQLTIGFDKAGESYFSPDMNWIIFQGAPKGQSQYQMYVAKLIKDANGDITGLDKPTQISPEPSRNTCGYFSPDGKTIIFASTIGREKTDEPSSGYQRQGGNYRWAFPDGMELFSCDDWQLAVAKAGPGGKATLKLNQLTKNDVYDAECAFSNDGRFICFGSNQNNNLDIFVSRVLRISAVNASAITAGPLALEPPVRITTFDGYDGGPFFSPDGKHLVYRSDRRKNDLLQIFVCDLAFDATGNVTGVAAEHQLTNDATVNWGPFWHPDGRHIIYATSKHGHANYELYMIRSDGTHPARITYSAGADVLPVFSPDGKYLMWTSKRSSDHTSQVFVAKFKMPEEE